jgi:hypothetical protein
MVVVMRRLFLLGILSSVTIAACGRGRATPQVATATGTPHATSTSAPANTTRLIHTAAQCIRDHGVPNFPDPVLDARGNMQIDRTILDNLPAAVQQTAQNACKSQINAAQQAAEPARPPATPAELASETRFAACMRQHGYPNFPDPDPDGTFSARVPGAMPDKSSPAFGACRQLLAP